ncbi:hypothetical protein LTR78_007919 [Recurvomyces mirabilis]|uniref:Uncharacterized protein n=1 Tax=Recurvomyces mirabilis TaxID=574656 RepID=A0AAE0WJ53_9PEZI|nr:hypothetical protein LTR78_007919 [Recurvomyces mirabilis]KAK5152454.1 hypothetical protein LTS14_008401 [Recurvomyces mirabilis]
MATASLATVLATAPGAQTATGNTDSKNDNLEQLPRPAEITQAFQAAFTQFNRLLELRPEDRPTKKEGLETLQHRLQVDNAILHNAQQLLNDVEENLTQNDTARFRELCGLLDQTRKSLLRLRLAMPTALINLPTASSTAHSIDAVLHAVAPDLIPSIPSPWAERLLKAVSLNVGEIFDLASPPLADDVDEPVDSAIAPHSPVSHTTSRPTSSKSMTPFLADAPLAFLSPIQPSSRRSAELASAQESNYQELVKMAIDSGKHDDAVRFTKKALTSQRSASWERFELLDALGCLSHRTGDLNAAKDAYSDCCKVAEQISRNLGAECCVAEALLGTCWATGALAMTDFQLSQTDSPHSEQQLAEATEGFQSQLETARILKTTLSKLGLSPSFPKRARFCESSALNRLLLCHALQGHATDAIMTGTEACKMTESDPACEDPAISHLLFAYALMCLGQRDEAVKQLSLAKPSTRSRIAVLVAERGWDALDLALQPAFWTDDPTELRHIPDHGKDPVAQSRSQVPIIAAPRGRIPSADRTAQQQPSMLSFARAGIMLARVLRLRRG